MEPLTQNVKLKTKNSVLVVFTRSAAQTRSWGRKLGKLLRGGEIIGLSGELGTGKTCFARGLAEGLGVGKEAWIRSPSFTVINEYDGRLPVYHIDLYRIDTPNGIEELNLRDYLFSDGVSVIEWFERLPPGEVDEFLRVSMAHTKGNERELTFESCGDRYEKILRVLGERNQRGAARKANVAGTTG
ncbi:MAG: tRNA (adenosine(37)-N6)-threonylcarbamoyltransferase complex ATPase subunit type 1 TsaE [Deltaproteobacteria bacterium]|nr:tRNA (adenosine(37)-N6)-threonylcarbamoyltransferase complex ATPase subunit type 1 TsaE [Deltaproteobacteria bacterium]